MLVTCIRAVVLYMVVILSLRLMGKRQLGELQPSEFVITILISNIATLPIEDSSIPMILGIIPILIFAGCELLISNITLKSKGLRSLLSGKPVVIISNGEIDQNQLKKIRFSIDDLMESLRQQNIFNVQDVQYAIVETTGKVSILEKFDAQNVTPKMLGIEGKDESPPLVVISDGEILKTSLEKLKLNEEWLKKELDMRKVKPKKVFLMTVDYEKNIYLIEKS